MLSTVAAPGTVIFNEASTFGKKAAKSFQIPYISVRNPKNGQPKMMIAMPRKYPVVPFHFSFRKKNLKALKGPRSRASPKRKATLPSASSVRSKSKKMPKVTHSTPMPQRPIPIFLLSSSIDPLFPQS
eukprot:Skav231206  [mRNA]  locus=scaffold2432:111190:111792:- [translate_table: standard]